MQEVSTIFNLPAYNNTDISLDTEKKYFSFYFLMKTRMCNSILHTDIIDQESTGLLSNVLNIA